jgi:hypothetical protein
LGLPGYSPNAELNALRFSVSANHRLAVEADIITAWLRSDAGDSPIVENTNGLLRQYFPKGTDLSVYSQAKLNAVARRLNEHLRKTLDYETPAERFRQTIASTG